MGRNNILNQDIRQYMKMEAVQNCWSDKRYSSMNALCTGNSSMCFERMQMKMCNKLLLHSFHTFLNFLARPHSATTASFHTVSSSLSFHTVYISQYCKHCDVHHRNTWFVALLLWLPWYVLIYDKLIRCQGKTLIKKFN